MAWSILGQKLLNYIPQFTLSQIQQSYIAKNLQKVLSEALKDKKNSHDNNEAKSAFQTIVIEFSKQLKQKAKKGTSKISINLH